MSFRCHTVSPAFVRTTVLFGRCCRRKAAATIRHITVQELPYGASCPARPWSEEGQSDHAE